ncbi:MAG: hypothetical protein ACYDCN_04995 [Bacteroidia bacterium]
MRKLFSIIVLLYASIKIFAQILIQGSGDYKNPLKYAPTQASTNSRKDTINNPNKINIIQIGVGGLLTSLNYFRNAQQFTYYPAFSARLYYQPNGFVRFVIDYSKAQPANIIPTWVNVKSAYLDIDVHFLMHTSKDIGLIYFIVGASSQSWKGFYTGIDDYNKAADKNILPNTNYNTNYFGGNVGVGFEFKILPRFDVYGEAHYYITNTDVGFGFSNSSYGAGIKYTLLDIRPKAIYQKPSKHYKWLLHGVK